MSSALEPVPGAAQPKSKVPKILDTSTAGCRAPAMTADCGAIFSEILEPLGNGQHYLVLNDYFATLGKRGCLNLRGFMMDTVDPNPPAAEKPPVGA